MKSLNFRDMERLSAYLDGQLSPSEKTRLEKRVRSNPAFAAALDEIRQTRTLLHHMPRRRVPRNFTLTPRMAGIRPPVPRAVPVLSWASAAAMLLFIFTLGTNLVGKISFGGAAPMMAAAPSGLGGGPAATQAPALAAPATQAPAQLSPDQTQVTPTPELFTMAVPEAATPVTAPVNQPPAAMKAQPKPLNPWLIIWPALAIFLILLAALVWLQNQFSFRRKNRSK
jgi:anti-sigma factor RsiW